MAVAKLVLLALAAGRARGQPRRLRIINGCGAAPMWIAHEASSSGGPDPQNVRIEPGQFFDFATPDGLAATRYWPKMGCDPQGNHCSLGGSGGPGQACVVGDDYSRCAPPIDTKFEATFGSTGVPCILENQAGCDFIDVSLVDGFTLPFKLEMNGAWCSGPQVIDCSALSFEMCPAAEAIAGVSVDLQAVNPNTGRRAGCYSPCSKLTMGKWSNPVLGSRMDPRISPFCCPTPPVTPEACRAGPITSTAYVSTIHQMCPAVYAYSFDDAMGLAKCEPGTQYLLTFFCPAEAQVQPTSVPAAPPAPPRPAPPAACKVNGACGVFVQGRSCQCGPECVQQRNCCPDYGPICQAVAPLVVKDQLVPELAAAAGASSQAYRGVAAAAGASTFIAALVALAMTRSRRIAQAAVPWSRAPQAEAEEAAEEEEEAMRREGAWAPAPCRGAPDGVRGGGGPRAGESGSSA